MNNVMVDLETLGTTPGAVILSIGAVFFDENGLGDEMEVVISIKDSLAHGLTTSPDTIAWWGKQSAEARKVIDDAGSEGAFPLKDALEMFNAFLASNGDPKKVLVWGNGADFDNVLLAAAYNAADVPLGWGQYNNRCYRTMKRFREHIKYVRTGTHHNALDDAKTQAEHLIRILKDGETKSTELKRIFVEIRDGVMTGIYGDKLDTQEQIMFLPRDFDNIEQGDDDPAGENYVPAVRYW